MIAEHPGPVQCRMNASALSGLLRQGVCIFAIVAVAASAFAAPPALPIDQAAALAQGDLRERGLSGQLYVASIGLELESLGRRVPYWYARWSQSIAGEEKKRETGLRINMDGSLVRMVETPNASREALTNHRTRSDRPSILDLKH